MPEFIPGLELSESFYREAAAPILEKCFPGLRYSAALIGYGSEVLGFDTSVSRDHHWGPRFLLFLSEEDFADKREAIDHALRTGLPHEFRGYPTSYSQEAGSGIRRAAPTTDGEVDHFIEMYTVGAFFEQRLKRDPRNGLTTQDWLAMPEQRLREIVSGTVFHDGLGELEPLRERLAYYPHDIWLYRMAVQWDKVSQLEAFVGRCGESGDELGSALVANRIVGYLAHLCFMMERVYAPYPKLFGAGFARLSCAADLLPILREALAAQDWKAWEQALSKAYAYVAGMHNRLGLTEFLGEDVSDYYGRPYLVIHAGRFSSALQAEIREEAVRSLSLALGSIDQLVDQPDPLLNTDRYASISASFEV